MEPMKDAFRKYGPLVYRRALVLLGDAREAEDATQDVFLKVMKNQKRFRAESSVSTWLYRVTTNHCLNHIRDQKNRARLLDERVKPTIDVPGAPPFATMVAMRKLIAEADERQARAAIYVYVDGMAREEVAALLDCSVRTVGNLLDRFNKWARLRLDEPSAPAGAELRPSRV